MNQATNIDCPRRIAASEVRTRPALGIFGVGAMTAGLVFLTIPVLVSGCSRHAAAANSEVKQAPRIDRDRIVFDAGAPQLGYLNIEPVAERKATASALSGRLAWDDDVTSRVFPPVSGRIIEIAAQPGQRVAVGDVLAKIRSPDFGQAQADARKAAADVQLTGRTLARVRDLVENRAAAQKDLEAAEADSARALSENERALANLALYGGGAKASDVNGIFTLKAPVAGGVVEKAVNPGQEVRSDQVADKPLFVISDPTHLWLYLDVTEADVSSLAPGQEVMVRARALPAEVFSGRVQVIGEGLDPATRTIKARCLVDNPQKKLRAEMYVSADVISSTTTGVDIPTKAIFAKDTTHYVFTEAAPGQFERHVVKLGLEGGGRSVILDGLTAGQRVVTEGALLLEAMLEGENS